MRATTARACQSAVTFLIWAAMVKAALVSGALVASAARYLVGP